MRPQVYGGCRAEPAHCGWIGSPWLDGLKAVCPARPSHVGSARTHWPGPAVSARPSRVGPARPCRPEPAESAQPGSTGSVRPHGDLVQRIEETRQFRPPAHRKNLAGFLVEQHEGDARRVVDGKAVAIVRLDRITDPAAVTVGGKPVHIELPAWANYRLGDAAAEDE